MNSNNLVIIDDDDDDDDDDTSRVRTGKPAIPAVIQRALGMHNLQQDKSGDDQIIVQGLEGFFLPHYLLLRSGQQQQQQSALPKELMQAWEEMWCRPRKAATPTTTPTPTTTTTTTTTHAEGRPMSSFRRSGRPDRNRDHGANKSRKRKRKSHHHSITLQHEGSKGKCNSEMNIIDASPHTSGEEQHNNKKRRRKKRRRKMTQDAMDPYHIARGYNKQQEEAWINYQILARVIIAPFTSSLLAVVKRCKQIEEQQQQHTPNKNVITNRSTMANEDDNKCSTTKPALSSEDSLEDDGMATTMMPSLFEAAMANNVYQKTSGATNDDDNNNSSQILRKKNQYYFLTLSAPQESLETIVDGAICTLVRRTHRFRCQSSSSIMGNITRCSNTKTKITQFSTASAVGSVGRRCIYRRRARRRKCNNIQESLIANVSADNITTVTTCSVPASKPSGVGSSSVKNHWLLEENLLSTGYTLGHGDNMAFAAHRSDHGNNNSSQHTTKQQEQQQHQLRGCPNMAPGIHCIHPNPLSSYGRSSTLMRFLHRMIGDEALREILVNCIVLLPAVSTNLPSMMSSLTPSSIVSIFHRGNYFQLCGPPITVLAKKFDEMRTTIHEPSLRKRKRRNDVESTGESDCVANCPMPRLRAAMDSVGTSNRNNSGRMEEPWNPNKPIPRGSLFYCDFYNKHVGLSPRHLLNQHEEKSTDGSKSAVDIKLLNAMTQIWPVRKAGGNTNIVLRSNKRRCRWRRLRDSGIAMCKEMRRRQKQCNYSRLLEHYCPLPAIDTKTTDPDGKANLTQHVTLHHTPVENVVSFLKAALRCAFPSSFWGSPHNFNQVVRTIRVFSNLGRTEQLPEKSIVDGIRVLDMQWLLPSRRKTDQPRRHLKLSLSAQKLVTTLVQNVMRWLYCRFVIPLLRSTFYITETEFTGSSIVYYRRPVWTRIKSVSMKILLKQQYRELNAVKVQKLLSNHNVGCPPAPLRILPKATGIRAIAVLSKSCAIDSNPDNISGARKDRRRGNNGPAPNKVLQSTFHALKYEYEKRPSLFGAGILGLTDVFPSFRLFVKALKKKEPRLKSTSNGVNCGRGRTPLYFASADIKHCYDTINQKRLYELMRSVVDEDVYLTKNNFILHSNNKVRSLRCRWKKRTFSPDQLSKFHHDTADDSPGKYFNSIIVEGVHCTIEKKEKISGLLRDHIFGQILVASGNYGQRYLLQHSGIPQGSILSSMLCNIYFGDIEKTLLDGVFEEGSRLIRGCSSTVCDVVFVHSKRDVHLLVRIVDDFLLISSSKDTSIRFLKKLNEGIPSLGVKINSDKSRANYPISLENINTGKLVVVEACHDFFPWCGLLIDTKTCEISLDYKRFWGSHSTDTVVIHRTGNEGLNFKRKMKDFVRPRCCQRLLFSSDVNRIDVIRLNFYQMFLLCAVKLVHYITSGSGETSPQHQRFIYDSACDTIHFAFSLISSKIKHGDWKTSPSTNQRSLKFKLTWNEALWLGKHAFRHVLRHTGRRRSETKETLKLLYHLFSDSARPMENGGRPWFFSAREKKQLVNVTRRARKFPILFCG